MSNFMHEKEHILTRTEKTMFTSSFAKLRDALLTD